MHSIAPSFALFSSFLNTKTSNFLIFLGLWGLCTTPSAQTIPAEWERADWLVEEWEVTLANPWVGGLTAPQWSAIDADLDGDEDLFAFDRDGSRILLFERMNSSSGEANGWKMRWDWTEGWPTLVDWCLLRDFNCDGKPDIFASHQNGIRVFTNISEPGGPPLFDPEPQTLSASFDFGSGPSDLPVVCIGMDLPAILDHDDDGDLDIITFTETATTLYRFEGQTPCGLDLKCTNRCYGKLAEASENNTLFIGADFDCSFNVADPRSNLHAGGAIASLQLETGGPKDLLISDVTYPEVLGVTLEVGGSTLDSAVLVDPSFPANSYGDQGLFLPRFPAGFHLDVDADGVRDLLFSPNTPLETDDDESVHLFKNVGSDEAPIWEFQDTDFLQSGMLEFGRGAYPVLADFDGDGLLDLAVANKERYEGVDQTPASVSVYRNVGDETQPSFELIHENWIPLDTFQIESPFPTFGDLDDDGDLDVIIGDELGRLHAMENVAPIGAWPEYTDADSAVELAIEDFNSGTLIDVGQFATPQLMDMDGDGDLDMVVGEKNGTLTLIERNSLGTWSVYVSPINGENWCAILVDNLLGINGYSVPALTRTEDGIRVFVANETGTVQDFGLASSNWDDSLYVQENEVLGGSNGFRCAAAFADVNGDQILDAFLGIQNGGLMAFIGNDETNALQPPMDDVVSLPWAVYPNPGSHQLTWMSPSEWSGILVVTNARGQKIMHQTVSHAREVTIDTSTWPHGMYFISPQSASTNQKGAPLGTPFRWVKVPH